MAVRKYRKALFYLDVCWEKEDIDQGQPLICACDTVLWLFLLKRNGEVVASLY